MQLSNFKIEPHNVERLKPFRFLGPKTKYTWSGEWTRNPQTGAVTPAAGTTKTAVTNTNDEYEQLSQNNPYKDYVPASTIENTNYSQDTGIFSKDIERDIENPETVNPMQQGGYLPKAQVGPPPEFMPNPFDPSPYQQRYQEQMNAQPYYRDYINKIKAGDDVSDEERARAEFLFDQTLEPMDQEMMGDYNEFMKTAADPVRKKGNIKNALTVDIPALYRDTMYYTKDITNTLEDIRKKNDYYANLLAQTTGRNEQFGNRGNYTINQLSNSSNFRPDLDGQIQYSQYGGPVVGEELEMTDEEIKKFLKGGGKLRYV
jgi:hypothetical protein